MITFHLSSYSVQPGSSRIMSCPFLTFLLILKVFCRFSEDLFKAKETACGSFVCCVLNCTICIVCLCGYRCDRAVAARGRTEFILRNKQCRTQSTFATECYVTNCWTTNSLNLLNNSQQAKSFQSNWFSSLAAWFSGKYFHCQHCKSD